jgi:hypothetical protein
LVAQIRILFVAAVLLKASAFLSHLSIDPSVVPTWFDNGTPPTLNQIGTAGVEKIERELTKWWRPETSIKANLSICSTLEDQMDRILSDVGQSFSGPQFVAIAQGGANNLVNQGVGNNQGVQAVPVQAAPNPQPPNVQAQGAPNPQQQVPNVQAGANPQQPVPPVRNARVQRDRKSCTIL